MKEEAEKLIYKYIKTIKDTFKNEAEYEHIITSILEIYANQLFYSDVLDQIYDDFGEIDDNTFEAIALLAESFVGYNRDLNKIYEKEL